MDLTCKDANRPESSGCKARIQCVLYRVFGEFDFIINEYFTTGLAAWWQSDISSVDDGAAATCA